MADDPADEDLFPSALCNCSQKSVAHVHCPCRKCKGKAVNRRTQLNHFRMREEMNKLSALESDNTSHKHQKSKGLDQDEDVEMSCKSNLFYFLFLLIG